MDTESITFPSKDRFTIWDPNPSLFTLWTRTGEPLPCQGSGSSLKHPQWTTHYRILQHYWIIIGESTRFPLFIAKSVKKPLQVWVSARLSANTITFTVPLLQPAWTAHMNTYTCNRHPCQQGCKLGSFSSIVRTPQPRKALLANTVKHTWQISEKQAHWIPGAAVGICSELQEDELKTITLALICVSKKK